MSEYTRIVRSYYTNIVCPEYTSIACAGYTRRMLNAPRQEILAFETTFPVDTRELANRGARLVIFAPCPRRRATRLNKSIYGRSTEPLSTSVRAPSRMAKRPFTSTWTIPAA